MSEPTTARGRLAPAVLTANQPDHRPYRGGLGIARFRGIPQVSPFVPEDFVASVTEIFAGGGIGLSRLPDGTLLRDAVEREPIAYLGVDHVRAFGPHTMLLVKLLDTQERLFIHYHPDDSFAASELGAPRGKTESWIVLDTRQEEGEHANAYLGFTRAVGDDELADWVARQDVPAMLGAMNRVPLHPGDTILVPAGTPHAIDPGVTLVELQQPSDLSILLEYADFPGLRGADPFLGLGLATAIRGLDRTALADDELGDLLSRLPEQGGAERLFPAAADQFFRAERIRVDGHHGAQMLSAGFGVLVVADGTGTLISESGELPLARGMTVLLAHASGEVELAGDLTALVCRPPAPFSV